MIRPVRLDRLDRPQHTLGTRWVAARHRGGTEDDAVLANRVRARLGQFCSHPDAIEVGCRDGRIKLRGAILASEADRSRRAIARVRGVYGIDDDLDRRESADGIPEL